MAGSSRIDELTRRVQMDPASIAFAALADAYLREGQFEDAIATCTVGLRRHPSYLSAHVTLARALAAAGRVDDARAAFEYVLQRAPENLSAMHGLTEVHVGVEAVQASAPQGRPEIGCATATATAPDESRLALTSTLPHHTVSVAPALLGLEIFLDAISRARTGRALVSAR
jgi:tetratricopeptide (TPR) repeat protein